MSGNRLHKVTREVPGVMYPGLSGFIPHGLFYASFLKCSTSLVHLPHTTWEHTSTCSGKYLLCVSKRTSWKRALEWEFGRLGFICLLSHFFILLDLMWSSVKGGSRAQVPYEPGNPALSASRWFNYMPINSTCIVSKSCLNTSRDIPFYLMCEKSFPLFKSKSFSVWFPNLVPILSF